MDNFQKLSNDGKSWLAAEAALAKAELASDGKRLTAIIVLAALACGSLLSAVIMISLFLVSAIAPYIGGLAAASALLVFAMLLIAFVCLMIIFNLVRSKLGVTAVVERWKQFAIRRQRSST